jgi:hypothetical protein
MQIAWIENNTVRDIANGNPDEIFHPEVAAYYNTEIPDGIVVGATLVSGTWTNPPVSTPAAEVIVVPMLSPVEFKMLFTSAERIAIKASTDAVVIDFFEIVNDTRLTQVDRNMQSVKDAIMYLETDGLLTAGRAAEILS